MEIAIDFDGTIVRNRWPKIGRLRFLAKPVIKWLKKRGHELILYTCREGVYLAKAHIFLEKHGIKFDYYNENTEGRIWEYGGDCRKISADLYLDDKALFPGWWIVPLVVLWIEWREKRAVVRRR